MGTGTTGLSLPDFLNPFMATDPTDDATELELMEVKLDEAEVALADLRQRLDSLGWWLGRLTNGAPLRLGPYDTNPMPQTDTWTQLQLLEAKLDALLEQPGGATITEVYNIIVQINILMVEVNQWVINLGGDVSLLEAKLDILLGQPNEITIVEVYDIVVQINVLIVQINQWINEIGSDVSGLETKLDRLQVDIDAINESIFDLGDSLNDVLAEIRANGDATARLEAKIDAGERAVAALEVKADAAAAAIAANGAGIAANGAAVAANAGAIAGNLGAIIANGAAIGVNNAAILANNAAILANNAAIVANGAAIAALNQKVVKLQDSNNRIEDKIHQLMRAAGLPAPPPAPDVTKITLTMSGGPLPSVPLEATVDGGFGAVLPGALVTVYWPTGLPPSTVVADGTGAFTLTETTGNISYSAVEVTQTEGGFESAPTRIPAA